MTLPVCPYTQHQEVFSGLGIVLTFIAVAKPLQNISCWHTSFHLANPEQYLLGRESHMHPKVPSMNVCTRQQWHRRAKDREERDRGSAVMAQQVGDRRPGNPCSGGENRLLHCPLTSAHVLWRTQAPLPITKYMENREKGKPNHQYNGFISSITPVSVVLFSFFFSTH